MKTPLPNLETLAEFAGKFLSGTPLGSVTGLRGPLGAGKTTFVREVLSRIAKQNGQPSPRVASPSFVIHLEYKTFRPVIHHFDLYRLENAGEKELIEIGYFEALEEVATEKGLLFVEWPDHCNKLMLLELTQILHFGLDEVGQHFVEREATKSP